MLTIVHATSQPCLASQSVTLVSMNWQDCKNLGERLQWAMERASVSRSDLATACGVSTVSVGKWINNDSKNMKMENLFMAADLCLVNAKWLAIGAGNPSTGVPTIYADVSGPDLQIARDLTKLDDRGTRVVVRELIAAKTSAAAELPQKTGKRSKSS
jgi:transcriptional regulator with XRE-family HTH domain